MISMILFSALFAFALICYIILSVMNRKEHKSK
ncbi:MAG: hypothetical protein EZS26_002256 [Candidatus Ordinivivax streblomastigis]|uniref:Uncharacterized protein n=1 Tax=Candidatus Ordinivivax streblomastigis TaxID=2540710 RepID=A0A5M8NZE1_9BACT|nr:MAG: hypothetical protein EZS26_002256 [Candidatus Ordinivivax streblomastigis]